MLLVNLHPLLFVFILASDFPCECSIDGKIVPISGSNLEQLSCIATQTH